MQVIICYEARPSSDTDYLYIKSFLDNRYPNMRRNCKISKLPLRTKGEFNKHENDITQLINKYNLTNRDKSYVVFCLDTDYGYEGARQNVQIKQYCQNKNYSLAWFNRNVEEVFIGHKVEDKFKVKKAMEFSRNNKISSLDDSKFTAKNPLSNDFGKTNLKCIFDEIFKK